jgi:Heavy metal associated domain 2
MGMSHDFHHVPGRLRIRSRRVKGNRVAAQRVCSALEGAGGITAIKANPLTGSVTITYDSSATDEEAVCRMLLEQGYFDGAPRLALAEQTPWVDPKHAEWAVKLLVSIAIDKLFDRSAVALIRALI